MTERYIKPGDIFLYHDGSTLQATSFSYYEDDNRCYVMARTKIGDPTTLQRFDVTDLPSRAIIAQRSLL